jgi:uncharacterized protein
MLCIYHGNCADGFASAWVVRRAHPEARFHAGIYQDPPPKVDDEDVLMVDFSYKRPVMEEIIAKAASVKVIDHHKSAIEDLEGLKGAELVFDIEHSGAMLTWKHFFPEENPPFLLAIIEDRDLWRFKYPMTRDVQAAVFSYPYNFEVWDELMIKDPRALAVDGIAIERKHFKDVFELCAACQRSMEIGGIEVPVVNLPYTMTSDAGHHLDRDAPFAACYWDTPGGRVFSLRSRVPDGLDVAAIAQKYGGGGHKHAAGFRVPFEKLAEMGLL